MSYSYVTKVNLIWKWLGIPLGLVVAVGEWRSVLPNLRFSKLCPAWKEKANERQTLQPEKEFVGREMPWQTQKNMWQLHGNWGGVPKKSMRAPSAVSCHTLVSCTHLVMDDDHITAVCAQPSVHGFTDAADFVQGRSVVVRPAKVQHLRDNRAQQSQWSLAQIRSESPPSDLPLDWVDWCRNAFHWGWRAKRKQTNREHQYTEKSV